MKRFAPLFVIFAASLWGVDGIILRPSLYTLPVPLVVFIESSIVAIILTPFFRHRFNVLLMLKSRDWYAFLAVALFGGAIGTMAITKALFYVHYVNLSVVVLIQKLQPVFALILAAVLLKEKLPKSFFGWAGLAITGTYLLTFGTHLPDLHTGDKTLMAALFALLAAFSFGASTVFSKRALKNVGFEVGTYLRFLFTAFIMLLWVSLAGDFSAISRISQKQAIIFGIIAFTSGGPAIFLYYYGLKQVTASVATICELAFPLTAIILEYIVHGKMLDIVQWAGAVLLIFSIIRISRMRGVAMNY